MEILQRLKLEKFQREENFMKDNAGDFPPASVGGKTAAACAENNRVIEEYAARQISGANDSRRYVSIKDEYLEQLGEMIRNMNRAANAFGDEEAGIELKFRLPRRRSGQNLLATGKSFAADAAAFEEKFVEYGLDEGFIDDLKGIISKIESHGAQADSAADSRAEATGGLAAAVKRGTEISRKLDSIVRIKYANNPAKLAAWEVASHLEKRPQTKKDAGDNPA